MNRFKFLALNGLALTLLGGTVLWGFSQDTPGETSSFLKLPPPALNSKKSPLPGDLIRVGISDDAMANWEYTSTQVSATGPFKVINPGNPIPIWQGEPDTRLTITRGKEGFLLSFETGKSLGPFSSPLQVIPQNPTTQRVKVTSITRRGKTPLYRGILEIVPGFSSPNKFSVVNVLPMEDYLKAVVPNELPPRYGLEAIKAQAVAARNYALRPREKPWPQFDICDSQYCQAYYGAQTEVPETSHALEETAGLTALYQGEPILALYSSSHGGAAESYENAFSEPKTNEFPAKSLPYLKGGFDIESLASIYGNLQQEKAARNFWQDAKAPSFDVLSPHYRWKKHWDRPELESMLTQNLRQLSQNTVTAPFIQPAFKPSQTLGQLNRIDVERRGLSGKVMALRIHSSHGTWHLQKEFVIRKAFQQQGRMLPSANLVFSHLTDKKGQLQSIVANGGGFGHGVGMSQLGASWMDSHGYTFPSILQHYYRGISIGSVPIILENTPRAQPVALSFYAKLAQGYLWLETSQPSQPVALTLNGQKLVFTTPGKAAFESSKPVYRWREPVVLTPKALNQLVLIPVETGGAGSVKAWVEVFPSAGKDPA